MVSLLKFLRWLFQKVSAVVLIGVLALASYGVWMFLKDNVDFDLQRNEIVRALNGEREKIHGAIDDVDERLDLLTAQIESEGELVTKSEKIIAKLESLESTWDRLIGNPEQQAANLAQKEKMIGVQTGAEQRIAELQEKFDRTTWEREGLEIALGRTEARLVKIDQQQSKVLHYLEAAWLKIRWWLLGSIALYLLGPSVVKGFMYYVIAPTIIRGRPVRLSDQCKEMPETSPSRVSLDIPLQTGERLWIKERFLQASDEGLQKKTRFLFDWRMPFTCLASGLTELVEMKPAEDETNQRVTLSNQANPHIELAVINLVEGSSLILRPSFLVGAIASANTRVKIRRRWQLFRWQAWVTLQFRFFEFVGPCRLIVAGSRGVRAEVLTRNAGEKTQARRANQNSIIGFTPNLDYRPVRAETFWGYYRGMNPLFDDLFAGEGVFLCQQIPSDDEMGQIRKFWAGLWSGVLKVFGL